MKRREGRQTYLVTPKGALVCYDFIVAFQSNTGHLSVWDVGDKKAVDLHLGMARFTSPSMGAGYVDYPIAFQAKTGKLWIHFPIDNHNLNSGLGMGAQTSPSLAVAPVGGFRVAFQANTGHLFIYKSGAKASHIDTGILMALFTSPAMGYSPDASGYEVAFQAHTGILWTYLLSNKSGRNVNLGMSPGSSPSTIGFGGT